MQITSPCTGICKLDEATGWCLGCGRSGDEIIDWRDQPEPWRAQVWDAIPTRLAGMGVACRRLPWTTEDIRDFVQRTLNSGRGTWVMGVAGAVAEFTPAQDQGVTIDIQGDDIIARTKNGAVRMVVNDDVRALTFDPPGLATEPRVVLAVKRERGRLPVADGVQELGPDQAALIDDAARTVYDLGLGRKEARFGVRVCDGSARSALTLVAGQSLLNALPRIAPPLVSESPTRVIETALGRIEVQGQIPPPDAKSPDGPHTHLLPDHLATGRAMPVGMDLPRAYLPGAIYYPPKAS